MAFKYGFLHNHKQTAYLKTCKSSAISQLWSV